MYMTFLENRYSTSTSDKFHSTKDEMIEILTEYSKQVVLDKDTAELFNCNVYTGDNRKGEYIQECWAIIFDIDGGVLSWGELSDITPWEHVIMNSFSNNISPEKQNRFRIVIPLLEPIDREQYAVVVRYILMYYTDLGIAFDSDSGNDLWIDLDKSKISPNSFYYVPCINESFPQHAFFHHAKNATINLDDVFDVMDEIGTTELNAKPIEYPTDYIADCDQTLYNKLLTIGHCNYDEWFTVIMAMKSCGYTQLALENFTRAVSHKPGDRIKKIPNSTSHKITKGSIYHILKQRGVQ